MLGVPYFPLSPASYGRVAIEFVVNSFWKAIWAKELSWVLAGILTALLLLVLAWLPTSKRKGAAEGLRSYRSHAPRLYALGMLLAVALGGWLVARAGNACLGRNVVGLLWVFTGSELPLKTGPGRPADRQRVTGLCSEQIRWCLFYRNYSGSEDADEDLGTIRELAGSCLDYHYGFLVRGTLILLVWVVLARWVRAAAVKVNEQTPHQEWAPLLLLADTLLGVPLAIIVVILLLLLPANYGVVVREPVYPVAFVPSDPRMGLCEKTRPDDLSETDRVYVLSQPDHDAQSVCLVRQGFSRTDFEYTNTWVVETRPLEHSWRLLLVKYVDILDDVRRGALEFGDAAAEPG